MVLGRKNVEVCEQIGHAHEKAAEIHETDTIVLWVDFVGDFLEQTFHFHTVEAFGGSHAVQELLHRLHSYSRRSQQLDPLHYVICSIHTTPP